MEKIAVVANRISLSEYIKSSMAVFFKDCVTMRTYSTDDVEKLERIEEQIVVISAYVIFKQVEMKIRPDAVLQTFSQVLSKDNLKALKKEELGQRVLLVNVDYYNCMQTITQLYEAGFQNIDFRPYCGDESTRDKSIRVAVTPNEEWMVPSGIDKVVNIGDRVVDINCVVELANKLGIKDIFDSPQAQLARDNVVTGPGGIEKIFSEAESVNDKIKALIEYMEEGVIIVDLSGRIYLSNQKAREIVGMEAMIDGFSIQEMIPEIDLSRNHEKGHEMLLKMAEKTIIVLNRAMYSKGRKSGNIITIRNYDELEDDQYVMRNRLSGRSHVARMSFSDIKGSSEMIKSRIESAKRMAKSNASVLITGPSGCGKEIFAQSIHNASARSKYNFVALNCAAIPENLLESELFGYENGAFTGARKEGKAGYFELAHKGTIFLDEIGEMALPLQSKLLRVIEERNVAKIGSSKLIDIDIRVIAATNQNLSELVRNKLFREDLFFRLNVLPLDIPPVRERGQDAVELLYYFRDKNHWEWELDGEVRRYLSEYDWPGNIREIRNLAEYLDSLERENVELGDLPAYMTSGGGTSGNERSDGERYSEADGSPEKNWSGSRAVDILRQSEHMNFILQEGRDLIVHQRILSLISQANRRNERMGRTLLVHRLSEAGELYSEAEIRNCLRKLSEAGYIKSKRGPGGSYILGQGEALLRDINVILG